MKHEKLHETRSDTLKSANLIHWLTDPRTLEYFGPTFRLRADVLAAVITNGNMAAVARQHGVTRAAAAKNSRRAKRIFGDFKLTASH
ncbi:MAG: hypothetical protein WDM76_11840 [Limisphaerales bacterium]